MITEITDSLSKTLISIIDTILPALFTIDTVVLMSVIVIVVESIKQAVKGNFGTKYLKMKHLENYQIRVLTIILGIGFSSFWLSNQPIKSRIMLGIFYGGVSIVLYAIIKKYFIGKVRPDINIKLSGQNSDKKENTPHQ